VISMVEIISKQIIKENKNSGLSSIRLSSYSDIFSFGQIYNFSKYKALIGNVPISLQELKESLNSFDDGASNILKGSDWVKYLENSIVNQQ
jgi:hypothetical protein